MSKHTPGPWVAVTRQVTEQVKCMEIAEISHMRIIPAGGGWPTPGTPDDDARLIAAAPDLLAAAKELVRWWDTPIALGPISRINQLRAAIAKAEGEDEPITDDEGDA